MHSGKTWTICTCFFQKNKISPFCFSFAEVLRNAWDFLFLLVRMRNWSTAWDMRALEIEPKVVQRMNGKTKGQLIMYKRALLLGKMSISIKQLMLDAFCCSSLCDFAKTLTTLIRTRYVLLALTVSVSCCHSLDERLFTRRRSWFLGFPSLLKYYLFWLLACIGSPLVRFESQWILVLFKQRHLRYNGNVKMGVSPFYEYLGLVHTGMQSFRSTFVPISGTDN